MKKIFCKESPRVFVPPVVIYAAVFFLSIFLQRITWLPVHFFKMGIVHIAGWFFIAVNFIFIPPAVIKFIKSRTTFSTMQPVTSLQTSGIYSISRNPMYLGLLCIYTGMALLKGNWWTIILIPLLVLIMNQFVIQREEKYLQRKFGKEFSDFKTRIRRWI